MAQDALDGKIDLIVTKSVSRFARNTVDSLTTVRKLKDVGVEVYFEKENIWTLDSKGELLDFAAIDAECDNLLREIDMLSRMIKRLVDENAAQAQSQTAYTNQYNSLVERFEILQTRYDTLQQQKGRRQIQADAIGGCLFALEELDQLQITFSEALWNTVVDHATVYGGDRLVFHFKNGKEISVRI